VSTATERKQIIDELADRVLEGRREAEAGDAARADIEAAAEAQAKQAFHDYINARERYALLQAELVKLLPQVADFMQTVADARARQEDTLRIAQKLGVEDLPAKAQNMRIQSARERSTNLQDWQEPLASDDATVALAALSRIRRLVV
jgi:hydroxypyruvate isomerase